MTDPITSALSDLDSVDTQIIDLLSTLTNEVTALKQQLANGQTGSAQDTANAIEQRVTTLRDAFTAASATDSGTAPSGSGSSGDAGSGDSGSSPAPSTGGDSTDTASATSDSPSSPSAGSSMG